MKGRMAFLKVPIVRKGDMADDAQPIGKDGVLVGITEVAVDVHLFRIRAGGGMGRHEAVSHSIGVNIRLVLIVGFEPFDKGIEGFRVIFADVKFNAGSVKGKDICEFGINQLADGFGIVHHLLEHEFNIRLKILLKTGQERRVRDFGKTAEVPEFRAEVQENEQKGIRRDGKDFLEDECGEENLKRVIPFPAKMLVKGIAENGRDEFLNVEIFIKELEERRDILKEGILTV